MQKNDCTRNCWIAGAAVGLLVWIFTSGIGHTSFMGGLFLGLITAVLMGLFLVWALCDGAGSAADSRDDGRVRATLNEPSDLQVSAKPMHLAPRSEMAPQPAAASTAVAKAAPVAVTSVPAPTPVKPAPAKPAATATPAVVITPAPEDVKAKPAAKPAKASTEKAKPAAKAKAAEAKAEKPAKKAAPKAKKAAAKPDDLKQIKGVGPKLEKLLHDNGITLFAQIAEWDDGQIDIFAERIGSMGGRIRSDDWVAQAKILASGGETEFSTRVEKGDVY